MCNDCWPRLRLVFYTKRPKEKQSMLHVQCNVVTIITKDEMFSIIPRDISKYISHRKFLRYELLKPNLTIETAYFEKYRENRTIF